MTRAALAVSASRSRSTIAADTAGRACGTGPTPASVRRPAASAPPAHLPPTGLLAGRGRRTGSRSCESARCSETGGGGLTVRGTLRSSLLRLSYRIWPRPALAPPCASSAAKSASSAGRSCAAESILPCRSVAQRATSASSSAACCSSGSTAWQKSRRDTNDVRSSSHAYKRSTICRVRSASASASSPGDGSCRPPPGAACGCGDGGWYAVAAGIGGSEVPAVLAAVLTDAATAAGGSGEPSRRGGDLRLWRGDWLSAAAASSMCPLGGGGSWRSRVTPVPSTPDTDRESCRES